MKDPTRHGTRTRNQSVKQSIFSPNAESSADTWPQRRDRRTSAKNRNLPNDPALRARSDVVLRKQMPSVYDVMKSYNVIKYDMSGTRRAKVTILVVIVYGGRAINLSLPVSYDAILASENDQKPQLVPIQSMYLLLITYGSESLFLQKCSYSVLLKVLTLSVTKNKR